MVFDDHGYALGPGDENFPDGRNFIQRGHGRTVRQDLYETSDKLYQSRFKTILQLNLSIKN